MTRPSHITEDRIRERAYRLWLEEGQPQGKDAEHWKKARELLALESDSEEDTENASEGNNSAPHGAPVEEPTFPPEQKLPKKRRPSISKKRPM